MKLQSFFVLAFSGLFLFNTNVNAQSPTLILKLDLQGFPIPPKLYGLITEEIIFRTMEVFMPPQSFV